MGPLRLKLLSSHGGPRLPQAVGVPITLQHRFLPQVDPHDLMQLPLGVHQVGQDTPQGLSTGLGCAIDGHAGHPPEVGHVHLSNSAECVWGDEVVRPQGALS